MSFDNLDDFDFEELYNRVNYLFVDHSMSSARTVALRKHIIEYYEENELEMKVVKGSDPMFCYTVRRLSQILIDLHYENVG